MIEFKEIYVKNYRSYQEFRLPIVEGKHLIIGPNGEGKSLLFQALMEGLYKCDLRGDDPTHYGGKDCEIGVIFSKDGDHYEVKRYWNPTSPKESNPQILRNCEDISSRKKAEGQRDIEKILSITYGLFINTVVVSQGLPKNFCELGPSVRSSMIEEILCQLAWDEMRQKIAKFRKGDLEEKDSVNDELIEKKEKMIALNSKIEVLKKMRQEDKDDLVERIKEIKFSMRETKTLVDTLTSDTQDMKEVREQKDALYKSVLSIEGRSSQLESLLTTKCCPTCKRDYPPEQIDGCEKEYQFLQTKIKRMQEKLDGLNGDYQARVITRDKLTKFQTIFSSQDQDLQTLCRKRDEQEFADLKEMETQLQALLDDVNEIKSRYDEITTTVGAQEWIDSQLVPSSLFRTKLVSNYLSSLNQIIESVSPIFGDYIVQLIEVKRGIEIELIRKGNKTSYKSFSGGEKRRIDIIIILSLMRFVMNCSGVSTNLLVFDEIFEHLDAKGIGCALDAIDALFPESHSIYIITHNDMLKSRFSSILRVVKEDGVSVLENGACLQ